MAECTKCGIREAVLNNGPDHMGDVVCFDCYEGSESDVPGGTREEHLGRCGLVVEDLSGGDYVIHLVSSELWQQIQGLRATKTYTTFAEHVGWLCCTDPDVDRPKGAPDREGTICRTWHAQRGVIEPVDIVDNLAGILFL